MTLSFDLAITKNRPLWQKVASVIPDILGKLLVWPAHFFGKGILCLNFSSKLGGTLCAAQPPVGYLKITKSILPLYSLLMVIIVSSHGKVCGGISKILLELFCYQMMWKLFQSPNQ